jgi:uncharacterized protein YjdB
MSGDPENTNLWADADLWVAPVGTSLPASATVAMSSIPGWSLVGLLEGNDGFDNNRSQSKTDHPAWGVGVVKVSRKDYKEELAFTALEDNETTMSLVWPGSTPTLRKVPKPKPILVCKELREGTRVKRAITAAYGEADAGSFKESEPDLTKYPIVVTIYPTGAGDLWIIQDTGIVNVTALTLTGTGPAAVGAIGKITATATLAPSGTLDVTEHATWTSSDPAVATVTRGFVEALDEGTAMITAFYGGESDDVTVTVA